MDLNSKIFKYENDGLLKEKNLKITIVKTDNIGDAILAVPFFSALRKKFPGAKITAILSGAGSKVIGGLKLADEIKVFEPYWLKYKKTFFLKRIFSCLSLVRLINSTQSDLLIGMRHYDRLSVLAISLAKAKIKLGYDAGMASFGIHKKISLPPKFTHETVKNLQVLQALFPGFKPKIKIAFPEDKTGKLEAVKILKKNKLKKYIVIHPVSTQPSRDWGLARFKKLIEILPQKYKIAVVGGAQDEGIEQLSGKNIVNLAGKTSLMAMGQIIKGAELVIGINSAAVHIGAAFNKKTLTIFSGVSLFEEWKAFSNKSYVITKKVPCRGCMLVTCDRHHECMDISPEFVARAAVKIITGKQKNHTLKINY